jgi:hypothetical protein
MSHKSRKAFTGLRRVVPNGYDDIGFCTAHSFVPGMRDRGLRKRRHELQR